MRVKVSVSAARWHRTARLTILLAMVVAPAMAQDTPADVQAACATLQNMPEAICACIAERSANELSADQRAFYVAALNGDDAETARLRTSMAPQALIGAVTFIRTSPADCAR
jgi:hypothetical protein